MPTVNEPPQRHKLNQAAVERMTLLCEKVSLQYSEITDSEEQLVRAIQLELRQFGKSASLKPAASIKLSSIANRLGIK